MFSGNANMLPGMAFRRSPGIGLATINVPIHETNNIPECSEIAPGVPGTISEHSGVLFVSCIGLFMEAISIPGTFFKAISGSVVAFPMTIGCVWIRQT